MRAALEASGLDHGPISVHDKMQSMGLTQVPSTASLARIFREAGVARREPKKKPRSAWRRFVYPAPNACWQLDGTEYVLTGGRRCVILQLIDDHSRYAVGSHVAAGETAEAAIVVFDKAVTAHGVPQRLLTDNGPALNPSRRGRLGQLVEHVRVLGVETITGKPYKPTTQGKNERFHQTLFRYLDKQPLADTLAELQAQVDAFDHIYNTQRPHQGLPGARHATGRVASHTESPCATPDSRWITVQSAYIAPARAAPNRRSTRGRPGQDCQHFRHHQRGLSHLHGRCGPRLRPGPRRRRRQRDRHREHRWRGRSRTPSTRFRSSLRRQPTTPRPTPHEDQTVTEVLTHQLSPKS